MFIKFILNKPYKHIIREILKENLKKIEIGESEMNFKDFEEKDMISIIYQAQEEKIDKILRRTDENIKKKLNKVQFERIIEDSNCAKQLKEEFNKTEDNYNMKIAEYNKEMYKQGFIDGVNLIFNCLKN